MHNLGDLARKLKSNGVNVEYNGWKIVYDGIEIGLSSDVFYMNGIPATPADIMTTLVPKIDLE